MCLMSRTRRTDEPVDPVNPRRPASVDVDLTEFDEDSPTPVLAVGTRSDLSDKARAAQQAQKRPPTVDDDVASLAHDLKNPLTIIMLETTQIEQRLASHTTPAVQRGLERISQNAAYIDRLVSDMLDLASHEAGKLDLRLEHVDLVRVLRDAVGRTTPTAERSRMKLELRDVSYVIGDEMRLERVISNLVSNALKYGDGPVAVRLDRRGNFACVSVIDTGPGLTVEQSRAVFERYRRGTTLQHGYGLGLYTSRKIIEAHRGRIGVQTQLGRGSRFFFELPLAAGSH